MKWAMLLFFLLGVSFGMLIGAGIFWHAAHNRPDLGVPPDSVVLRHVDTKYPRWAVFQKWGVVPAVSYMKVESKQKPYPNISDDVDVVVRFSAEGKCKVNALLKVRFTPVLLSSGKYDWIGGNVETLKEECVMDEAKPTMPKVED